MLINQRISSEINCRSAARIKAIGLGDGGSSLINRTISTEIEGVEFLSANTDAKALVPATNIQRIQLGETLLNGQSAGGNPVIGAQAAAASRAEIAHVLAGADLVFITAGMGGGTGTGAIGVVAEVAKELGAFTVALVTRPFSFEGLRRIHQADEAISKLPSQVDALIVIPNDRLLQIIDQKMPMKAAFQLADDVLRSGIQWIGSRIETPGSIDAMDIADLSNIMTDTASILLNIDHRSWTLPRHSDLVYLPTPAIAPVAQIDNYRCLSRTKSTCHMQQSSNLKRQLTQIFELQYG